MEVAIEEWEVFEGFVRVFGLYLIWMTELFLLLILNGGG